MKMWFHIVFLASLVAESHAYSVTAEPEKFICTRNDWTYEPVNCYIDSMRWKGELNLTSEGVECQQWVKNSPHTHSDFEDIQFPDGSIEEAGNKCRDPIGYGSPWCYTMDPDTNWQFCDVPLCIGDVYVTPDVCTQCLCSQYSLTVVVECEPIECPVCPGKVVPDDSCCGVCDLTFCVVDGQDYKDGEVMPTENPCYVCQCVADGTQVGQACELMACPVCHGQRQDDGTCCGQCNRGCLVDGNFYEDDEEYQDGCNHCQCTVTEEGPSIQCVGTACALNCHETMLEMKDGDCCPTCAPGCYDNVTDEIYVKDEAIPRKSPCETCYCSEGELGVYQIECDVLQCLPCDGKVKDDGSCCGICHMDGCLYEGERYNDGDIVPNDDPCLACVCKNDGEESELICHSMDCFCPGRTTDDGTCCGICESGCFYGAEFYMEGANIPSDDPCVGMACERGEVEQFVMMCEPCIGRSSSDNTCCGTCEPGCFVDDIFYIEGAIVPMPSPCDSGYCHYGELQVMTMSCEMCYGRWTDDGTCCGSCEEGCMVDGTYFKLGADVPMSDPCSFGICTYDGKVDVITMPCPPCPGMHVPDGTCCGQCLPPTTKKPSTLGGPVPPSTEEPEPVCDPSKCPDKLPCPKALQFKTQDMCCRQCKCKKDAVKYVPGPVGDKCDGCMCDGNTGEISCMPTPMSSTCSANIECVDPVRGDDCCYTCPNGKTCLVRRKKFVTLKYGEYYRTKGYICTCGGDGWYPFAFCTSVKRNKKKLQDISPYFAEGIFDLGKN